MKKFLVVAAVVFLLVVSVRPVGNAVVDFAVRNQEKAWAPDVAFQCCRTMYWLGNNRETVAALEKCVAAFPASPYVPRAYYWTGRSLEKERDFAMAKQWYEALINQFPGHPQAGAAKDRLEEMAALGR